MARPSMFCTNPFITTPPAFCPMGAFDAIQFKPESPFSILNRGSTDSGRFANAEFEPGFKSKKAFQRAAKPVLPRVGIKHPKLTLSLLSRHRNLLRSALALSRRGRQRRNLPQHAGKQPPCQMTLCQQQPVVPGMLYQTPAGFHQPLLQAGQRPVANPLGQRFPCPRVLTLATRANGPPTPNSQSAWLSSSTPF